MQKIFLVLKKRIFAPNSKPEKYDNIRKDSDGDMFAGKCMELTGEFIKKINDFEKQFPIQSLGIVEG